MLSVCATPIGNLEDVTLRVLRELAEADLVLCEDTRRTRILLDRHGIAARLLSYHEHNEAARTAELLPRLRRGRAGRARLGRRAAGRERPGREADRCRARGGGAGDGSAGRRPPSRPRSSRAARGRAVPLPRLPPARRRRRSRRLWEELTGWPHPAVAFESPQRLPATLRSLAAALPQRRVAVCRELTKRLRGGRARERGRGRRALRGAAEGGDHARARPGRGPAVRTRAQRVAAVAELVAAGVPRRQACRPRRAAHRRCAQPPLPRLSVT